MDADIAVRELNISYMKVTNKKKFNFYINKLGLHVEILLNCDVFGKLKPSEMEGISSP
jgi:hypothetical protein